MTLDQTRPQAETLNRGGRASQLEPDSAKRELAHCGGERRGSRLNMSELQGSGLLQGTCLEDGEGQPAGLSFLPAQPRRLGPDPPPLQCIFFPTLTFLVYHFS